MKTEELIDSIAYWMEQRFKCVDSKVVVNCADDVRAIKDGYMSSEQAGAMIVDLIKELAEEEQ